MKYNKEMLVGVGALIAVFLIGFVLLRPKYEDTPEKTAVVAPSPRRVEVPKVKPPITTASDAEAMMDPECKALRARVRFIGKSEEEGSMSEQELNAAKFEVQLNPNIERCRGQWRAAKGE